LETLGGRHGRGQQTVLIKGNYTLGPNAEEIKGESESRRCGRRKAHSVKQLRKGSQEKAPVKRRGDPA